MPEKEARLKVAEAIQDDVNKGIVRIDSGFLNDVGVRPGDIIELEGERKTVAIADRAYPGDIGLNIVRMDGIIRKNSKTGIGEMVQIRKANVKEGNCYKGISGDIQAGAAWKGFDKRGHSLSWRNKKAPFNNHGQPFL